MHFSCTGITCAQFDSLGISDEPFLCSECCRNTFPFHNITNDEFNQLFTNVTLKEKISDISFISSCNSSLNDQYLSVKNFTSKFSNNNDFFILHINIRSLNKNTEKLEELLNHLDTMPDIIALYETKLNNQFCNHLLGYQFVQANSNTNAGGVGMFIKNNINFSVVNP